MTRKSAHRPNSTVDLASQYVLEFVSKNKGTTRADVVNNRPENLSRVHVFQALAELIYYKKLWNFRDGTLEVAGKTATFD